MAARRRLRVLTPAPRFVSRIRQERADERRIQIIERQGRRCFAKPRLRKREQ